MLLVCLITLLMIQSIQSCTTILDLIEIGCQREYQINQFVAIHRAYYKRQGVIFINYCNNNQLFTILIHYFISRIYRQSLRVFRSYCEEFAAGQGESIPVFESYNYSFIDSLPRKFGKYHPLPSTITRTPRFGLPPSSFPANFTQSRSRLFSFLCDYKQVAVQFYSQNFNCKSNAAQRASGKLRAEDLRDPPPGGTLRSDRLAALRPRVYHQVQRGLRSHHPPALLQAPQRQQLHPPAQHVRLPQVAQRTHQTHLLAPLLPPGQGRSARPRQTQAQERAGARGAGGAGGVTRGGRGAGLPPGGGEAGAAELAGHQVLAGGRGGARDGRGALRGQHRPAALFAGVPRGERADLRDKLLLQHRLRGPGTTRAAGEPQLCAGGQRRGLSAHGGSALAAGDRHGGVPVLRRARPQGQGQLPRSHLRDQELSLRT